jgi:hypothetical protein
MILCPSMGLPTPFFCKGKEMAENPCPTGGNSSESLVANGKMIKLLLSFNLEEQPSVKKLMHDRHFHRWERRRGDPT